MTDSMIEKLIEKGVKIPSPESVFIGDEVDVDRISRKGVVIYPGCRIYGRITSYNVCYTKLLRPPRSFSVTSPGILAIAFFLEKGREGPKDSFPDNRL